MFALRHRWSTASGALANGHLRRDLLPRPARAQARGISGRTSSAHATLRLPKGEAARDYNTLQKLAYLGVLVVLIPVMVLTGLTMSPAMDAAWPWLLDLFGGRQIGALDPLHRRLAAGALRRRPPVMVVLAGPVNEIRSMITGRYRLPKETER